MSTQIAIAAQHRVQLTRGVCGTYGKHFSGFEFILLPNIVHARPSAMLREHQSLGGVNDDTLRM
jgi:hypothetical protein